MNAVSPEILRTIQELQRLPSLSGLLPQVYDYKNPKVSDAYVTESKKTMEKQIQKAGIRLASVLQVLFKSN